MESNQHSYQFNQTPYSVIHKLTQIHQINQIKERKAQSQNKEIIMLYEKRKSLSSIKIKQKEMKIINKLNNNNEQRLQKMNKKAEQLEKAIHKFHKLSEEKIQTKIDSIEKRNIKIRNSLAENKTKEQFENKSNFKNLSRSLDLKNLQKLNLASTSEKCKEILENSIEKQRRASLNRLSISENQNKTKEITFLKELRKMKADEREEEQQTLRMKRSILKFEQTEKIFENLKSSQRRKSILKSEKNLENLERAKKKREFFEAEIEERLRKAEEVMNEKNLKNSRNKENLSLSFVNENAKKAKQREHNFANYQRNVSLFHEKMSENYKKDRQQESFITNIERLKESLIQRNIYENNKLSLLK